MSVYDVRLDVVGSCGEVDVLQNRSRTASSRMLSGNPGKLANVAKSGVLGSSC